MCGNFTNLFSYPIRWFNIFPNVRLSLRITERQKFTFSKIIEMMFAAKSQYIRLFRMRVILWTYYFKAFHNICTGCTAFLPVPSLI